MDYKLFIGIDVTNQDDISDEIGDDFDVYVNDGEDFMLLGTMLYSESSDITARLYQPMSISKISKEKTRIKKAFPEYGKVELFIINDEV